MIRDINSPYYKGEKGSIEPDTKKTLRRSAIGKKAITIGLIYLVFMVLKSMCLDVYFLYNYLRLWMGY